MGLYFQRVFIIKVVLIRSYEGQYHSPRKYITFPWYTIYQLYFCSVNPCWVTSPPFYSNQQTKMSQLKLMLGVEF